MMNKLSTFIIFLLVFVAQQTYASLVTYDFTGNYIVLNFNGSYVNKDISDDPFAGRKFNGYVTFDNSDEGYTGCCDNTIAQYFNSANVLHINFETTSGSYAQFQMGVSNIFVLNNWQANGISHDGVDINSWTEDGATYQPFVDEIGASGLNYYASVDFSNDYDHSLFTDTKLSNKKIYLQDYNFLNFNIDGSGSSFNGINRAGWSDLDFIIAGGFTSFQERLPTPVDIPSTAPLFFTGLLMLLFRRTRKNS